MDVHKIDIPTDLTKKFPRTPPAPPEKKPAPEKQPSRNEDDKNKK